MKKTKYLVFMLLVGCTHASISDKNMAMSLNESKTASDIKFDQQNFLKEFSDFKSESLRKLKRNQIEIQDFKIKIAIDKSYSKELRSNRLKSIMDLDGDNNSMIEDISVYKALNMQRLDTFKLVFNQKIRNLNRSMNKINPDNSKTLLSNFN